MVGDNRKIVDQLKRWIMFGGQNSCSVLIWGSQIWGFNLDEGGKERAL